MSEPPQPPPIKCVIWDLDETVWDGVLLESGSVRVRPEIADIICALDARGVLHSIASHNDERQALAQLEACALAEYFLYPQVNWEPKAASVEAIARLLNISLDAVVFVDDDEFQREAVRFAHPLVRCIDARSIRSIDDLPVAADAVVTEDAALRRRYYQANAHRQRAEESFSGTQEQFLATLDLIVTIGRASEPDLDRAEELTLRTHQLNSTGVPYSKDALRDASRAADRRVLMVTMRDRFGAYGQIGLVLLDAGADAWTIRLLLTSCRVASRGVGGIVLRWLTAEAAAAGTRLLAHFVPNDRNRIMGITFRLAGFREHERRGDLVVFEHPLDRVPPVPSFVRLEVEQRVMAEIGEMK